MLMSDAKSSAAAAAAPSAGEMVDVSRLNMRIGRIIDVKKHPDADSLYVEQVDVGEAKNRTVVSGLVKHVPIEQVDSVFPPVVTLLHTALLESLSSSSSS